MIDTPIRPKDIKDWNRWSSAANVRYLFQTTNDNISWRRRKKDYLYMI